MSLEAQLIGFVVALMGVITTLAGLVHKGDLDRVKDRDAIIAKQEAIIARFEAEAAKTVAAKDMEIAEWRTQARSALERAAP